MILVMDAGNTNIKSGVFEGDRLVASWRMQTDPHKTSDEYGILMLDFCRYNHLTPNDIDGVIISSVVPSINYTLEHMVEYFFQQTPIILGPGIKTGINIKYDNPKEVGSDRIANAVAAFEFYGGPCVVIDFGSATTFGAISEKGEFLGGAIFPGIKLATDSLTTATARLPRIELVKPESVIGRSTVSNMQSVIVYGYVGLVDYIVNRMKKELGGEKTRVVATGGMVRLISEDAATIEHINPLLTLQGLRLIYERNRV